jgi:hypothetical protein
MKFLCSKTVRHHFWPGLIPPLQTGGTYSWALINFVVIFIAFNYSQWYSNTFSGSAFGCWIIILF